MAAKQQGTQAVVRWRESELVRCGFPALLAARVARDERCDLQQLIELVEQGCSPALAVRILSPFKGSDRVGGDGALHP
ncbi:MAG TPA: hypothetical protein VE984_08375 [Gaiellaceae bacterium]|nr:hypothetical protein [Gaiellaceae bacterium]